MLGKLFKSSAYSSPAQISLFSKHICRLKTYMTRFHWHLFLGLCGILKSSSPKEALVLGFHLSPFLCRLFHQSDKKTWFQCLPKVLFTPGDRASVLGNRQMVSYSHLACPAGNPICDFSPFRLFRCYFEM